VLLFRHGPDNSGGFHGGNLYLDRIIIGKDGTQLSSHSIVKSVGYTILDKPNSHFGLNLVDGGSCQYW